jgi:hypothetical protein
MRPRTAIPQTSAPCISSPLRLLLAAVPDEALRPLVLLLLEQRAAPATAEPAPARKRASWPKGRPRGPRSDKGVKRGPRAVPVPAAAITAPPAAPATDPKPAPRGHTRGAQDRQNAKRREKRAAARAATESTAGNGATGSAKANGAGTDTELSPAQRLWEHAKLLSPREPWKAVAGALGTNMAQAIDCWRHRTVPPGMTSSAVERFLALPAG